MQGILGYAFLTLGVIWAAVLLTTLLKQKQKFGDEPGKPLPVMLITESVVYFLATMGISDFLMNTIVFNRYKSGDTAELPGTVNLSTIVPGTAIPMINMVIMALRSLNSFLDSTYAAGQPSRMTTIHGMVEYIRLCRK